MSEAALNLSNVDPAQWRVLVNGSVYGPYTLGQMYAFIRDRRVGPKTQVSYGDEGDFVSANQQRMLAEALHVEHSRPETDEVETFNYLIIAKLTGTGEMQLVSAINRLGSFAEVMSGVWALRSKMKQNKLREKLQQTVSSADQVMVANASTGRLSWLNLGPEADIHIRRVWDADLD